MRSLSPVYAEFCILSPSTIERGKLAFDILNPRYTLNLCPIQTSLSFGFGINSPFGSKILRLILRWTPFWKVADIDPPFSELKS